MIPLRSLRQRTARSFLKSIRRCQDWGRSPRCMPRCWPKAWGGRWWCATIVAAAGPGRGELLGRAISPELEQLLAARSVYTAPADRTRRLPMLERSERPILCAAPILAHGDIEGGVLLPGTGRDALPEEEAVHAVATAAAFLAKWMEE